MEDLVQEPDIDLPRAGEGELPLESPGPPVVDFRREQTVEGIGLQQVRVVVDDWIGRERGQAADPAAGHPGAERGPDLVVLLAVLREGAGLEPERIRKPEVRAVR